MNENEKTTWNEGEYVSFRLDNNWFGTGYVKLQNGSRLVVKLDAECKEFAEGDEIIVETEEVIVD